VRYRVQHVTRYEYADPVSLCHNIAHLKPREMRGQRVLSSQLVISPWPSVSSDHTDIFGNRVSYFSIQQSHASLEVSITSELDLRPRPLPDLSASPPWEEVAERVREGKAPGCMDAHLFSLPSRLVPEVPEATALARACFTPGRPILEAAHELMGGIFRDFEYDPHFSTVATPVAEVIEHRRGVCQDFAHLALAGLRGLGLAARYVSGYLETLPPPGQSKLQGADASHAWFSVFVPGEDWVDFDPTNDQIPTDQHIITAIGRDFHDVTPLRGVFYGGGENVLEVAVDVDRLGPRTAAT